MGFLKTELPASPFPKVHFFEYAFKWKSVVEFNIIILHFLSGVNILYENYGKTSTENKFKKVYLYEIEKILDIL